MYRVAACVCAAIACVLIGWASYTAVRPQSDPDGSLVADEHVAPEPDMGVVVENAEQDLGGRPVGESAVVFRIANRSDSPGEIVGYPCACGRSCCFFPGSLGRRAVPPGETVQVAGAIDVRQPGAFEFEGTFFLNDGGVLRTVRVRLTGVGVAPEGKAHAPP
jgi:hypothetical protein